MWGKKRREAQQRERDEWRAAWQELVDWEGVRLAWALNIPEDQVEPFLRRCESLPAPTGPGYIWATVRIIAEAATEFGGSLGNPVHPDRPASSGGSGDPEAR